MKKLFLSAILFSTFAAANVIPVNSPERLVQDELFPYQWGLLNQGQTIIREKDDIHNLPLQGVAGKDIGWKKFVGTKLKRRPIVAVLDSGVDLGHPELQGNLWTNEAECGKDPKIDNDGNRLAGDCRGWNFTEDITSDAAKDPSDIDGHGTHIAGIIAALNNGTGMVGVTPNALIMPIKVMRDSNSSSNVPSSVSFARGIQYAVDNGADVINMSLGWPRSLETKELRDAVSYALSQGVVIVAAAGNNNSSEPLFPCAYDGVVCVAASSVDGKFAGFSNFGGHVDTIAPGESILGLNPTLFEPDFFSVPGYELRSGTSQAAPFVAAMIAALRAENGASIDEVFAKLYQAQDIKDSGKYILGGVANWETINAPISGPVIRPIFKRVRQVVIRGDQVETKLGIPVRNFGLTSGEVKVKIESLSKAVSFESEEKTIAELKQGQVVELPFTLKVEDMNAESTIAFKVIITENDMVKTYVNEIPVVRDIRSEAAFSQKKFVFKNKVLPLGGVRNGEIVPYVSTLPFYGETKKHELFLKRTIKSDDDSKLELTLFTRKGDEFVEAENLILLDHVLNLVNFVRVDLNFDGVEDYLVHALAEEDGKKYFVFSFFNENLEPLWPDFQTVKLKLDLQIENMNDLSFVSYNHPKLGKIMVPAFFTVGQLPKVDQVVSSWDKYDGSKKRRLYFLEPQEDVSFRVRSFTTNVWEEKVKTELKSKWYETVETEALLPTSAADAKNGQLRVLVSVGMNSRRQLFIHTFDSGSNTHGKKLPQLVLQSDYIDPLLKLTPTGLIQDGEVYFNVYDRTRSKMVATQGEQQLTEYIFRHDSESDLIAGHIVSFENNDKFFSVMQTREKLVGVISQNGKELKRTERAKLRYSFLSQKLLSEMYFPVMYNREGESRPALYVDATAVTANRLYLFEEQNGELVSSVRNSLIVPSGCKSLNPSFNQEAGSHEFVFLCLEGKSFMMRTYDMK